MKRLTFVLFLLVVASMAWGQSMVTNWEFTVDKANMPDYFSTDADDVRGIAAHGDYVYLGSFRSKGIKVLDAASGDSLTTVNESAISLGDVEVDEDGVIFGSKMVGHDGQWLPVAPVVIYMWSDTSSVRDTLLTYLPDTTTATGSPYFRLGDKFNVVGSYADGSLEVYIVDSGWWGKRAFKFTMDGAEINPVPEIITFSGTNFVKTDNQAMMMPIPGTSDYMFSASGQKITQVGSDGVWGDQFSTGIAGDGNAFSMFEENGRKFVVQNLIWSAQSFQVLEWTDGILSASRHWGMTPAAYGPSGNNGNMVGDIEIVSNGDGTANVYAMMTDNGIGAYTIKVPVAPVAPENMTALWEVAGNDYSWFKSSGDQTRGMGYNPATDELLLASRTDNIIHVVDAATGSEVDSLDMTDVTGGFYGIALMKAVADADGVIYACNLASGGDLKIYRWADKDAAPTVALQQNVATRFGDVLAIHGSGTDTRLYLSERSGTQIKVFGTEDGLTFSEVQSIPISAGAANGGISVVDDAHLWINAAWADPALIDTNGTVLGTISSVDDVHGNILAMTGPKGEKLLAVAANHSEGNRRKVQVVNYTNGIDFVSDWAYAEMSNFEAGNGNVAGDLHYKLNEDGSATLFQMATNNAFAAWNLEMPPVDQDVMISYEDDSDVANWGLFGEATGYTTVAYDEEEGALKIGDGGYSMVIQRPVYVTGGTSFKLSMGLKALDWTAADPLNVSVVGGGIAADTVDISAVDNYSPVIVEGTAHDTATQAYIKVWGSGNTSTPTVYVKMLIFDDIADDVDLVLAEAALDYGKTAYGSNRSMMVKVYNEGNQNLVIDNAFSTEDADSAAFSALVNDKVIAAGDSGYITITFNPFSTVQKDEKIIIISNAGMHAVSVAGFGYELWPVNWQLAAGDEGTEWFWTASLQHYVRALGYNHLNNHVYVVSRIGGPHIYILDGSTGEFLGELDNTGIAQNDATFHVNTVDVTEDGQIFVASLGRTPNLFNVYHWADETAAPTMVFSKDVGIVAGDALSVAGSGTNITLYSAGHWSSNEDEINKMLKLTTTDLSTWTETLVDLPAKQDANYGISTVGNGDYVFVNGTGPSGPLYMKSDGTVLYEFSGADVAIGTSVEYYEVETDAKGTRRFIALTNGWSSGVEVIELLGSAGDGLCDDFTVMEAATPNYATISNGNATAMSVYNSYDNSVIELVTNNGITSYSMDLVVDNAVVPSIAIASVAPTALDFGTILASDSRTATFTVTNTGTSDLVLTDAAASNDAYSVDPAAATIAAGADLEFTVTFAPVGLDGAQDAHIKLIFENSLAMVSVTGNALGIEGNVIDEDFAAWTEFGNGWMGSNATFWDLEGYGRGDDFFIGGNELDTYTEILTPMVMNPKKLLFYFGEYSGGSDVWDLHLVVSKDGETWDDTLGTYNPPGNLNWIEVSVDLSLSGAYYIGFITSETVTGAFYLDDIMVDGDGFAIEGTAVNEDFSSWTTFEGNRWGGENVSLRTDGYGNGDDNYIGPDDNNLDKAVTFKTPRVLNPTYVTFWYAQFSSSADAWTMDVFVSEDGETFVDTLAEGISNPGNLDWKFAGLPIEAEGELMVIFRVQDPVSGAAFLDNVMIDGDMIVGLEDAVMPTVYDLSQNYPNPFNPTTSIKLALPEAGDVKLSIFNILGQEVYTLQNGPMEAGFHTFNFHITNQASGVYFYRVQANDFVKVRKMTILK